MAIYNKRYINKILTDPLPELLEDERIYLNVSYNARGFAKATHCGFDPTKKLWFTGLHNTYLPNLIKLYGVNNSTSEKAMNSLKTYLKSLALKDNKSDSEKR
ncbi:MAG: hypothetical protein IJO36_00685 [Clostridia bacterium]|nr:hypothetical protein [Clostridia bacterium]